MRFSFVAAMMAAVLVCFGPADAQTAKTKAQLQTEVSSQFADNTVGAITPAVLRGVMNDYFASWQQAPQVNAQTGGSYTIVLADYGKLLTLNNAAPVGVILPQANGSFFPFNIYLSNLGAGTVTINPQGGSTINGSASFTLPTNGFVWVVSDGTNYQVWQGLPGNGLITGTMIGAATITSSNIAAGTITGSNIATNTVANSNLSQAPANTVKGNGTGAPATVTDLTTIPTATMPALTGDVTSSAGTVATTIQTNIVSNSKLAQAAALTVKGNLTTATANEADNTMPSLSAAMNLNGNNIAARFGAMDVWQRGAGGSASISVGASTTAYTVDGCYLATGANEASTVAAVAGIAGGSFKAAAVTRNSGQTGTTSIVFGCPFDTDEILQFAGQFVTLSFTASTGANWSPTSGNLVYELFCGTGAVKKQTTGYTGQTTPINTTQAIAAGASAARYQSTSAAIVPANCTQAEIQFNWTPTGTAGAADTITIDDVQLEIVGSASALASSFQHNDFDYYLNKAQRHFAKTFPYGTAPAQNAGLAGSLYSGYQAASVAFIMWRYPRQLRAAPTVTTFNPSAANANCRTSGGADVTATIDTTDEPANTEATAIDCAAGTTNQAVMLHATADAGI